jgi:DNA topoisomerase-1
MALAQQLYEGISLGSEGEAGLITYMRTDSTNVASSALAEARAYIGEKFGKEFLPASARVYTRKVKGAREAHEAIRRRQSAASRINSGF